MAVDRNRKLVPKEKTSIYLEHNTLDEAIALLERLRESYGGKAVIKNVSRFGDDYLALMVETPETDQQMNRRIAEEEQREKREREDYERLAKKFGKA